MIWKNPFLLRQTEKIDSETDFLQLFSAEALNFINEETLNKVQYIRSSPGAGKTTVFKALQPNVLGTLYNLRDNDNLREFYKIVTDHRIIERGQIKLLSCLVSCAKNYDIIDEIFQNGRRQQVLFALLNVRITLLILKNILIIKSLQNLEDLRRITFKQYPEETGLIEKEISDGYGLYNWARFEEKKICSYIDSLSDDKPDFSLFYNNLFLLKLFEPNNVLFDQEIFLNYTLIIFDDMQKLTNHQRTMLIGCFYTMRPSMGIWIGERLEALSNDEIISADAYEGREFGKIQLEEYWRMQRSDSPYKKILTSIADKRVKLAYADTIGSFMNCIADSIEYEKYEDKLNKSIIETQDLINSDKLLWKQYSDTMVYIDKSFTNLYERAFNYGLLEIKYKKDTKGQIRFDLGEKYNVEDFKMFAKDSNNKNAAEFYLSLKSNIPYYYGMDRLTEISSYNIEQFLAFAGVIFGKSISKKIIQTGKKSNYIINAEDQEKYIKEVAEQRWDDILQRFQHGRKIQIFLNNFCTLAQKTRDSGTNPYTGGAATGIAIAVEDVYQLKEEKYKQLLQVLCDSIASNYFEKRIMNHDKKRWMVLYFNRWLCVKYDLPLKYGGWRKISLEKLNAAVENDGLFTQKTNVFDDQIPLFDMDRDI